MSVTIGKNFILTEVQTLVLCPICSCNFDASDKAAKAKFPCVKTKCPKCKGKITILFPVFGGSLKCWETDCPPGVERLETFTKPDVNLI